jgi:Fe2+ transport system protein FeoA
MQSKIEIPVMSSTMHQHLNELPSGARAVVCRIEAVDEAMQRLMAMGLCVGRAIEIVRQGNPLILRILGARIGVSNRLARHVVVTLS